MKFKTLLVVGFIAIAIGSLTACATGAATGGASERNRISGEELASTNSPMVYEALQMLRPQWMRGRGPVSITDATEARANVYMNGTRLGDLEALRDIYVVDVAELRFWSAGEAGARFGMGNPRGVIEVILKH